MEEIQHEKATSPIDTETTMDKRFVFVHEQVRQLAQSLLDGVGAESSDDVECVRLLHHEVDFLHKILKRFPTTADSVDLAQSKMSSDQDEPNRINEVQQELRLLREMDLPTGLYFAITSLQLLVDGLIVRQPEPFEKDLAWMMKTYPHTD